MDIDLRQFAGLGGYVVVQALVELVKQTFPDLPTRWYPSVAVMWGVLLNLALASVLSGGLDWQQGGTAVLVGMLTGLLASGLFAWGKSKEAN